MTMMPGMYGLPGLGGASMWNMRSLFTSKNKTTSLRTALKKKFKSLRLKKLARHSRRKNRK